MGERYDPPSEKVDDLVAKYTKEQLAIAYLRSQKRARDADSAFKVMDGVAGMAASVMSGDYKGALKSGADAKRVMRTHADLYPKDRGS